MERRSQARPHEPETDRAALAALVARFRRHHEQRIKRAATRLMGRQRRVLDALPMLYHRNHPALPGWVGADVPCGISGFQPRDADVAALRRVSRSFDEPRLGAPVSDLQAMFLMGSSGTIGQGSASDIDLWICCDTLLHSTLWPKVRMIDQWAAELGLELHTFLVDPDVLRIRRRLPGTRIPTLVLDEFYRSGALMAGRYPLWWLIDDDDADAYQAQARRLIRRRFVAPEAVVDFGPVPPFPVSELAQSAITELDRALATPHKSLLKLKLMEAYAGAPELGTVSATYKARVHAGETDPLRLDPYLLLYDHVQRHLERQDRRDEIDFVRALLIGKAADNAREPHLASAADRERAALLERFLGWGFSPSDVARFRDLQSWPMRERMAEHERIMTALERGLELVERLVRRAAAEAAPPDSLEGPGDGHQLHWLNETRLRRLRFAMTRMRDVGPGTVPVLHPALVGRRRLLPLSLSHHDGGWLAAEDDTVILRRRRLVEVAVWAELNGATLSPRPPHPELIRNLAQILQGFRGRARSSYVFVNAEAGNTAGTDDGASLFSLRTDPLQYTRHRHLDLQSLDVVARDDSGHWQVTSAGDDLPGRFARMLCEAPDTVVWQVIGGQSRFAMAQRLEQLHALAYHILDNPGSVFVLPVGAGLLTVRCDGDAVDVQRHPTLDALRRFVRSRGCAPVGFDPAHQRLKALLRAG